MKMGTVFFVVMMGIVITLAFAIVVINRESSQVVNAAVPVAFAALAALALVFAFAQPEPISGAFPVAFYLQRSDKLPVVIPDRPFPWMTLALVDRARQRDPRVLEDDASGWIAYHEFLQKALVDWIAFTHAGSWRLEVERFEFGSGEQTQFGPKPDAAVYKSSVLTKDDLERAFGSNRFVRVHSGFGKLTLPPSTALTVRAPEGGLSGEIRFKNWFTEIIITTTPTMPGVGLGPYTLLLGFDPEEAQEHYWGVDYVVRARATFQRLLIGHPMMAAQREWAEGIIRGIEQAFGEERIWRRTVDSYMLRQHRPATKNPPLGPVRSTPPEAISQLNKAEP